MDLQFLFIFSLIPINFYQSFLIELHRMKSLDPVENRQLAQTMYMSVFFSDEVLLVPGSFPKQITVQ